MAEYSKAFRDAKRDMEYAVEVDTGQSAEASRPDYRHPSHAELVEHIEMMRACADGTHGMRAMRRQFLPLMAREDDDDYNRRLGCAVAYNAVKKTAAGLAGMVFRKDMEIEAPDVTMTDLDDVDLLGNDIQVFTRRLLENALVDGYRWVAVDAPARAASNREEEIQRNIRPYFVDIDPIDAINWQYTVVNGQPMLSLFVYREWRVEPAGEYGQARKECYRVLRPGSYAVYEKTEEKGRTKFVLLESGTTGVPFVTVVFVPTFSATPEAARSPLLDIAHHQIAHFRRFSLYDAALDYAVPMPVVIGEKPDAIEFGANRVLFIPDADGDAKYLEMTGGAIAANREQLQDLKHEMAQLGLSILSRETRAAETATSKEIDKSESDASLAVIARALQSCVNQLLWYYALYRRNEPGRASINRDFLSQRIDAQTMGVLSQAVALGQISLETMWDTLIAGEVLPDTFDPEMEMVRLGQGLDA